MKAGRPSKSQRTDFGERLHGLRLNAALSQQQVAQSLGISQPSYALWERRNVSVTPDQLIKLAKILGIDIEELFFDSDKGKNSRKGLRGQARRTFEILSNMPRHQQKKVIDVVQALISAQSQQVNNHPML
ncbi:MAG: helix-turn-helix transcriptional regulator [Chlamydiae bacterium]|nr:helix-turn-helix transcriptional regulator [Chlamydiota bacterium]MBI3266948.1 helix-turn-helix transcriptional regulator [Chlamydiota bacterium]